MVITPGKRNRIITLSQHTSISQRMIAEECKVGLSVVNRILNHFNNSDSFSSKCEGKFVHKSKTLHRSFINKKKQNES